MRDRLTYRWARKARAKALGIAWRDVPLQFIPILVDKVKKLQRYKNVKEK